MNNNLPKSLYDENGRPIKKENNKNPTKIILPFASLLILGALFAIMSSYSQNDIVQNINSSIYFQIFMLIFFLGFMVIFFLGYKEKIEKMIDKERQERLENNKNNNQEEFDNNEEDSQEEYDDKNLPDNEQLSDEEIDKIIEQNNK